MAHTTSALNRLVRRCHKLAYNEQTCLFELADMFHRDVHVQPGYLAPQIPRSPPQRGEAWGSIMKDVQDKIMPGD